VQSGNSRAGQKDGEDVPRNAPGRVEYPEVARAANRMHQKARFQKSLHTFFVAVSIGQQRSVSGISHG